MKFNDYKLIFITIGLIFVLIIAYAALADILYPAGEQFTELFLFGPNYTTGDCPYNIRIGQNYSIYVGVTNHMGCSQNYMLYVKLRNETDLLPNSTDGTPTPVQPLYEYRFSIEDGHTWESFFAFSISTASTSISQATIERMVINNAVLDVNKPATWNSTNQVFYYQLIFELWLYNNQSNTMEFDNRFVCLSLNYTQTI